MVAISLLYNKVNIESQQGMNSSVENLRNLKLRRLLVDFHHSGKGAFLMWKWLPATRTKCKILCMTSLVYLITLSPSG